MWGMVGLSPRFPQRPPCSPWPPGLSGAGSCDLNPAPCVPHCHPSPSAPVFGGEGSSIPWAPSNLIPHNVPDDTVLRGCSVGWGGGRKFGAGVPERVPLAGATRRTTRGTRARAAKPSSPTSRCCAWPWARPPSWCCCSSCSPSSSPRSSTCSRRRTANCARPSEWQGDRADPKSVPSGAPAAAAVRAVTAPWAG